MVSDLQNILIVAGLDTINIHDILNLELKILYLIRYATDLSFSLFGTFENAVYFFVDGYDNTFEIDTFFNQKAKCIVPLLHFLSTIFTDLW